MLVVGKHNMGASALQISMHGIDRSIVSVFVSLIDDLVATLHRAELANTQVLLKALELLQVLLEALYQVVRQRFLTRIPIK